MEFLIDAENNARNAAFLNKTKNQAKKLFKLAKQNQLKIEINNLSHAQEILAHINGFPDWHALEKTVNNAIIENELPKFEVTNNTNSTSTINLEKYLNIPILRKDSSVYSFISVTYLPSEYKNFVKFINWVMQSSIFQYNMGFHNIQISIEQHIIESIPQGDFQYFTYNNNIGMDKEQFESLFKINIAPQDTNKKNFGIDINICLRTYESMLDEHVKFCKILTTNPFEKYFNFNEIIDQDELNKYERHDNNSERFSIPDKKVVPPYYSAGIRTFNLEDMLIKNPIVSINDSSPIEHTKWIHALYLLSQRLHQWKIVVTMNDSDSSNKTFTVAHSKNEDKTATEINNRYLLGLFKSLTNTHLNGYTNIHDNNLKMFTYNTKGKSVLPWKAGIPLINRIDNSVDYYQPASTLQSSYNTLIFAKPGSGKSLLMHTLNLGITNSPGFTKLPHIGIVDIGPASVGLISLLKESLPIEKQHLVQYHKIKMSEEYCVNIFDTQLGCRFPTNTHREYLTNFLSLLVSSNNQEKPESGISGLIETIISEMYMQYSDNGKPKLYVTGVDSKVDRALMDINFQEHYRTTWWEIVDKLFLANKITEATIAQRHAVPLLSDVIIAAQSSRIENIYSKLIANTGEKLIAYINRGITEALLVYKILARPTVFDISNAKIACIDLDEVAKVGSVQAEKQTAIMYLLANHILSKDYKLNYNNLNEMPYLSTMNTPNIIPVYQYKSYHQNRIETMREEFKQLCFDEFHRVSKSSLVKDQLIADMRYGRQWNIGITLASQSIRDFDTNMTSFATTVFIMDGGSDKTNIEIGETFNLNSYETSLLNRVHGPMNGHSGVMLAKFTTAEGNYTKLLSLVVNPLLLIALSTNSEDVIIRNKLTAKLGYWTAINLMSKHSPLGFKKIVEARKDIIRKSQPLQEIIIDDICKEIISEMLDKQLVVHKIV